MSFNQFQYQDMLVRQDDLYAQTKYKIIVDYLKNKENLKILNAGCGSGELSFLLAEEGHRVTGFDPSEEYVALAGKNIPEQFRERCSFTVSSIENFASAEKYDCVVATDVLEHIQDDKSASRKLAQLVRPGGMLIITVPALQSLFGYHDEQLDHFRRYSRQELITLLEGTGAVMTVRVRYFGFTFIPICYLYSKRWRKPYPVARQGKRGLLSTISKVILKLLLSFDRYISMPLGTSLIYLGIKN